MIKKIYRRATISNFFFKNNTEFYNYNYQLISINWFFNFFKFFKFFWSKITKINFFNFYLEKTFFFFFEQTTSRINFLAQQSLNVNPLISNFYFLEKLNIFIKNKNSNIYLANTNMFMLCDREKFQSVILKNYFNTTLMYYMDTNTTLLKINFSNLINFFEIFFFYKIHFLLLNNQFI